MKQERGSKKNRAGWGIGILLVASAAMAQGAGDVYEPDDRATAARPLVEKVLQYRSIHPPGDVDWVQFTVRGSGARDVVLESCGPAGDTEMWLYRGSTGALVAYDDDSGYERFARIAVARLPPGTYRVKIQAKGNDRVIASYNLRGSWTTTHAADAFEPDNRAAAARTIANGRLQRRSLHRAGDVDWAKFTIGRRGARGIRIDTAGTSGDTRLWLYGPDRATRRAAYDDNSGPGLFSRIALDSLAPGTYWIRVAAVAQCGAGGVIPAYTLRARWTPR
jgi:hypothetical protein